MPLTLTESASPEVLLNTLIPVSTAGVTIQNVVVGGNSQCRGTFSGGSTVVTDAAAGFPDTGIVLGTGKITDLNTQDGTENYYAFRTPGDLDIYDGVNTGYDACTLEFEFQCTNSAPGLFSMEYTFSSDEYIEQVNENSGYSDAFKVILNGDNLALTPTTNEAISVYNVNEDVNPDYFVFNDPRPGQASFPGFEPDGFTKGLAATGTTQVGWNTLKIGIVDVGDYYLDSWLFMKSGTFSCPQEMGSGSGDPHFRTFNDQYFSYHGQCDLVLTHSDDFSNGKGLDVHVRTTRVNNPHMDYSYISGAAVKVGNDILEVSEDGTLTIDGSTVEVESSTTFAGYVLKKSTKGSKQLITVYDLELENGKNIQIRANLKTGMIFIDVNGALGDSVGLLGGAPGAGKALRARDGKTDLTGNWNSYGEEWQVNSEDPKLFQDSSRHPQYPKGCVYEADQIKSHVRRRRLLEGEHMVTKDQATNVCSYLEEEHMRDFCVNDIMATGDLDLIEDPFYSN